MKNLFRQKRRYAYLGHLCRRAVALILALALVAPMTSAFAAGSSTFVPTDPDIVLPHPLEAGEEPTITIEANAVVNRWYDKAMGDPSDYLTGDLEVAIRVKSGQLADGTWQPFNTLGVALDYSPILTPYSWTLIDGIDLSGEDLSGMTAEQRVAYKTAAAQPVSLNGTKEFEEMTSMQTLKSKKITAAVAHVSGTTEKDAEGNITAVKDGHLYMMAQADRPVVLEKDTVLAVVTFKYDVENIKILASQAPDWYQWLVDTGTSTAAEGDEGDGTGGDGTGDTGGTTTGGVAPEDHWLVRLTTVADVNESYYGGREVRYDSEDNSMYHSATRQPLPAGWDNTTTPATQKTVDNYIELNKDVTKKVDHQVNFALVNQTTYNDGGLTLDDLATVLFYDWDDTLLGLVIVPKDGDARKIVNDYIGSHFIHPQLTTNTNYTSLARVDNYRGKYPTTAMSEEDAEKPANKATTVADGGEYALTNKLDYVFFKRPMERAKITVGTGTDAHEVDGWKQKSKAGSDGSEGDWDTEYPYLYGWAQVPDYRHPENVWTTLGMGELNSYSGSNLGGYVDIGVVPATVVPTDTNFKFADFDFRVRNSNSLTAGSIYAVKAVYEPGEGLRSGAFQYRMISEPYYNKLNAGAASNGGAYSVDITFERASVQVDNFVRGVARTREPYVRQDTTVDSLWMVNEDKNIDHDLPNVTNYVAYTSKAETTYTKVEVENSEEVFVSLTLSARQNKVDYYLKEGYGANFVVGDARTPNDYNRSTQESTLDNYNYFVEGQSDEFDTWFDATYEEREGTQGFVFNGTINQVMQKATQCNNKEITTAEFNQFLTENVFKDINLRLKTGKAPETTSELATARNAVMEAAKAAKPSNNTGSTKYWDTVHDCAQLTYHELQGFIIDGSLNHDESPVTDGSGKVLLNWCHLHKDCVDAVSTKPKNWTQLIDKAKNSPDDIDGLTVAEIENLFHLRKNSVGTKYDNVADFKADIVRAVNAVTGTMTTSWDQIQANILKETLPAQVNERSYWWYNGAESVPLNSLADTVAAAQDAIKAVKLPDGTTMVRYDKLNQLKPAYEENKASPTVARSWNNATKNLCITKDGSEGEKFNTFADFRSAFVAAVTQAENNNITLTTTNSAEVYAYWQKLQYHILKKSYSTTILPEMNGYWWYDGMSKIGDLPSLLAAAQRQVELDKAGAGAEDPVFKMFGVSDLYDKKLTELHFRSNFHGDQYTDLTAFKNAVKQFVQLSGVTIAPPSSAVGSSTRTNSWNQLQYYLLHPGCDFSNSTTVTDYMKEIDYYWWRGGADGAAYPLTANPTTGIGTLMEAVYRHVANGNPKAYEQLDAATAAAFRLIPSYDKDDSTITGWDTLAKYSDTTINTLYTALDGLYAAIPSGTAYSTITWRQIQHYLLKTEYKPADGTDYPSDKRDDVDGYWWKEGNERPTAGGDTKTDLDYFLVEFDKFLAGEIDNNALTGIDTEADSALDNYLFSGRLGIYGLGADDPKPLTECDSGDLVFVRFNLSDLANYMLDNGYTTAVGVIDWYVLQYYSMANDIAYGYGDPIISPADALDYYENTLHGTWIPNEYKASASSLKMFAMMAMRPNTTVDVDPDTGITTVTTTVETELENGQTLVVETVVTIDPETNETETRTVTTLLDEEGNVLSSTETVSGQPEPPAESPVPTESETPAPSESVGADVPIGPETSPEPTESLGPDVSPSPEPSESPAPSESETPAPSESVGADVPIGPETSPEPTEFPRPDVSPSPEPSDSPEELPDPEVPKGETPDPTESPEPTDPAEPDSSAGADNPTDSGGSDNSTNSGETNTATGSVGADVLIGPRGTSTLSAGTLNSGPLAKREKQTNSWLSGLALNWGRSRPPASSGFMGSPRWTLPGLALDWRNILTIGRTHA